MFSLLPKALNLKNYFQNLIRHEKFSRRFSLENIALRYGPYNHPMNVFTASKGSSFCILFILKRMGVILNVMRQFACLVLHSVTVDYYASFLNGTPVGWMSGSIMAPAILYY